MLLLGEPACGKATIAAALALGALDEWGCSTLKVGDADDFVRHSNPHEKQYFWIDDAFGAPQFDWATAYPEKTTCSASKEKENYLLRPSRCLC